MSGSLSDALSAAESTLLASATFVNRILANTADQPEDHVHLDQLADNSGLDALRPYALLRIAGRGSNPIAEGIEISLTVGGGILLLLDDISRGPTHRLSYLDFLDFCGNVIDDLEDLSGQSDYLPFKSELIFAPQRTLRANRTSDNDYWTAVFLLNWGDNVQ